MIKRERAGGGMRDLRGSRAPIADHRPTCLRWICYYLRRRLNPHLVKAARNCIDLVILNELCHLKEHNHSPQFWKIMDRVTPNWREVKRELDERAEILLND